MIWYVQVVDRPFIRKFSDAGEPDQAVIEAFLKSRNMPLPQVEERRWYYVATENPRIGLTVIERPLHAWLGGPAKLIIGTREIIGEFTVNRELLEQRGLRIKCEPSDRLCDQPDRTFNLASEIFTEISEQILDKKNIERSQRQIRDIYRWKK